MVMQNQIYTELVNDTQARAPEWARRDSDPVDSALQANATVMTKALTFFNGRERAAFLSTATGADLDAHGIAVWCYSYTRRTGRYLQAKNHRCQKCPSPGREYSRYRILF